MGGLLWQVLRFELHFHGRQPLIYVVSILFFLLAFGGTASENITIGGGAGNANLNSPFVVMQTLVVFSIIGMLTGVAFAANPVLRDFEHKTAEFFYTTHVDRFSYLIGRFIAAFLFSYLTLVAASLGVLVGEMMPWLDQERIADTHWGAYFFVHVVILIPNCFILASTFFCAATLARSMFGAYLVAVALIVVFSVISSFTDPDVIRMTAFADPFGLIAFFTETRYWTVFDRNTRVPEIAGDLLLNRALWISVGIAVLVLAYRKFPFNIDTPKQRWWQRKPAAVVSTVTTKKGGGFQTSVPGFGAATVLSQFRSQIALETRITLRSVPFIVLLLFAVFNLVGGSVNMVGSMFGTPIYPATGLMLVAIRSTYVLMILIVIIYYGGELVTRDRAHGLSGIIDATPWPNWIMVVAKILALFLVIIAMLLVAIATAMVIQVFHQYYNFQLGLYLIGLTGLAAIPFYLAAVLSITVQAVVQNKFLGFLIMTLYMVSLIALPGAGFPHQLYRLTVDLGPYSGMNGFGHFLVPLGWFTLYWSLFAILLGITAHLTWSRGELQGIRARWQLVKQRLTLPVMSAGITTLVAFVAVGGYIFYNTNVLNEYRTTEDLEELQAAYEKKYKQFQYLPAPQITNTRAEVDIYPSERSVYARGTYTLANRAGSAIEEMHVLYAPPLEVVTLEIDGAVLASEDTEFNYRIYHFSPPLPPGTETEMRFATRWLNNGFVNHGSTTRVVYNGTFVNNQEIFPVIGYQGALELTDNNKRRKYDLGPVQRASDIDDVSAQQRAYLGDWHRGGFDATVSTSADQIAMAPGYLERDWTKDGRRYFHYRMDEPIWDFYAFLSADYEVVRDEWRSGDTVVAIEVYHQDGYNIDTMIRSTKDSLDYFTSNFSPYQYRQFRILEFPAYARFAAAFPNTIPYSESIGFLADLRDPENIDYVYYVTAHELAHQWWAHQVISADTQGAAVLVETLSQYSALMVMEQTFGTDQMHRFLRYELDRYLTDRGGELIEELPLRLVENQGYIHYRKGSVAMYALKDAIGADAINRVLRRLIDNFAFKGPPYPTTTQFIAYLREEAGPEHDQLITDLFEKIVLYDLKVEEVTMTAQADGQFAVELRVSAKKYEASGDGRESEVAVDGYFDVAVLGEEEGASKIPKVLHSERVHLTEGSAQFSFVVVEKPVKAGIDPWFKQIDRVPTDNVKSI